MYQKSGFIISLIALFLYSVKGCSHQFSDRYSCCPEEVSKVEYCPFGCYSMLDVLWIVDSGGHIGEFDWMVTKTFINDVNSEITGSASDNVKFALVTFAATATVNFNFDLDSDDVEDAISNAPHIGGTGVNYQAGIDVAVSSVLFSQHDSPSSNACIFMAAGGTAGTAADLQVAANSLHAKCERVLVIGITDKIDPLQLAIIAPNASNRLSVNDFNVIVSALDNTKITICVDPPQPPPNMNSVVFICPIFPYGSYVGDINYMYNIGRDMSQCALQMCEARGSLSMSESASDILGDKLDDLEECIDDLLKLMVEGESIMSSNMKLIKKIKKFKKWLKQIKKQKAALKKKLKALWKSLTKAQKKELKTIKKSFVNEMKRLCKKVDDLIAKLAHIPSSYND